MLFHNGQCMRVRASVEHLDTLLYSTLTAGDELVIYRGSQMVTLDDEPAIARLNAIVEHLQDRGLSCAQLEHEGPTRLVWSIVLAAAVPQAAE